MMRAKWSLFSNASIFCGFALLLLSTLGKVRGNELLANLEENFNHKVRKCSNLHDHVCNYENKKILQFIHNSQYALLLLIAKHIPYFGDDVQLIAQAVYRENAMTASQRKSCRMAGVVQEPGAKNGLGTQLGQLWAMGVQLAEKRVRFGCTPDVCHLSLIEAEDKRKYKLKKSEYGKLPNIVVKGIVQGYLSALGAPVRDSIPVIYNDIPSNFFNLNVYDELKTFSEKNESLVFEMTPYICSDEKCKHMQDVHIVNAALATPFAPFFNALFSFVLYKHRTETKPEVADEFEKLMQRVKDEIVEKIEIAEWMTPEQKEALSEYMKNVKMITGLPKDVRDWVTLEEIVESYRRKLKSLRMRGQCDLEMIARTIGRHRNVIKFSGKYPQLQPLYESYNHEDSLFTRQALHYGDTIHVFPGFLHTLNSDEYPLGFKYGYAAWAVGHELFHGLGLNFAEKEMAGIATNSHFKAAQQCYKEYYGSFCMGDKCPDGEKKSSEGFADVESARVVYSLLVKALDQRSGRQKRSVLEADRLPLFNSPPIKELLSDRSSSERNERKWFFKALALVFCDEHSVKAGNEEKFMKNDVHPRATIRANAIVRQLAVFSNVFSCKAGDPNYVQDNVCSVYPFDVHDDAFPEEDQSGASSLSLTCVLLFSILGQVML